MREELLQMAWEVDKSLLSITKEQYMATFDEWSVEPLLVNNEVVAVTLSNKEQFHFMSLGKPWRLTRAHIRQCLNPILKAYGVVRTTTPIVDTRQHRFNLLLGFVPESRDENFVNYKLEELRHV